MSVAGVAMAAPPPVEAFANLPQVEYARLSPDGRYLAVVKPVDGRDKVAIYDLTKTDVPPQIVGMDGAIVGFVAWKSNDIVVIEFHANIKRKDFNRPLTQAARVFAVNMTTKKPVLLMFDAPWFKQSLGGNHIVDMDAGEPEFIYMSEIDRRDVNLVVNLYRVDLITGHAQQILGGGTDTYRFITDGYGHVLGRIDQDWDLTEHLIMGGKEIAKYSAKGGRDFSLDGVLGGATPSFVAEGGNSTGMLGLYNWTPDGGYGTAIWENPNFDMDDLSSPIMDERDQRIIGVQWIEDTQKTKYFDAARQHVQETLEKAFPGQSITIYSKDAAGASYAFKAQGPKNPPVLYLYTTANHQVNMIDEGYPLLKPADLGDVKPYDYKSSDGLGIHAYLTLPPGKDPKNLPVVIFPHGGPQARDWMQFDWWAQFMASRGYAVLQPNFRGSSGYGQSFILAGDGEWAGKVQDDVRAGVKKLIADGIADPKRICIVGASYGGYMALAGATFSPDLYACAVSYAGLSDLSLMVSGSSFESEGSSVWRRRIGGDTDSSKLHSSSPVNFAASVKIPVLLLHSDKDVTVPIKHSEAEESALRHAGKQVEFVTLAGDDHYLELADARIKMLKEVDRFLTAHIGN